MLPRVGAGKAGILFGLLVAIDLVFVLLHVLHIRENSRLPWLANHHFRIDADQGFAELFQYLKLMLIIIGLGVLWARYSYRIAGIWAAVFMVILLDDALMHHEQVGLVLAGVPFLPVPFGMSGREVGELLVWAAVAVLVGVPLAFAHALAPKEPKRFSTGLFFLVAALVFFGVGVDIFHSFMARKYLADTLLHLDMDGLSAFALALRQLFVHHDVSLPRILSSVAVLVSAMHVPWGIVSEAMQETLRLDVMFTLLEEGGEMLVVSAIAAYCLWTLRARSGARLD